VKDMGAIAEFRAISIDCADPQRLQDFHAEAIDPEGHPFCLCAK
jgi:hypothetical protein